MFSTTPPSFQVLQTGIPPTANSGQTDSQKSQKSPFAQQSALLPPPSHYPGIKVSLPPQGNTLSSPAGIKTFRRGSSITDSYNTISSINPNASVQGQSPTPNSLFEKHGICHSLSYISYLKSIANETLQDESPESSPSPPPAEPMKKKSKIIHKKHRKLNKLKRSARSKIITSNGEVDINYSSSCPSSPNDSGDEDSKNLDLFDIETEDKIDKALSKNPEEFFFSNEFLENENVYEEKPNYDLLRDCRILTDEEVARRRHDKINRLNELYRNEFLRLKDIIRVRHRRFFLRQVVKDNEKAQMKRRALLKPVQDLQPNDVNVEMEMETEMEKPSDSSSLIPDVKLCSIDGCQKRCVPLTNYCFNRIK